MVTARSAVAHSNKLIVTLLLADNRKSERGASLIEYALLLALIVIVCIGAIEYLGSKPAEPLNNAGSTLGS